MTMQLLYFSCHAILEYDENKLFEELGINYFSLGSYVNPTRPVDSIRPPLRSHPPLKWLDHAPPRDNVPDEFFDEFDTIIFMHADVNEGNWVTKYWPRLKNKGKRVILRTIGQNTAKQERLYKPYKAEGLEIVRYSPRERQIQDYAGEDAMIRFYKDPTEFNSYNGKNKEVITFCQDMKNRAQYCNHMTYEQIVGGLPAHVYGPRNDNMGSLNGGMLTYGEMKQKMRDSAVYLYVGTQPASYTLNFIEAWMTGIPIVALGPRFANSLELAGQSYEIPDLIRNGYNGFWSDDISEIRKLLDALLTKPTLAKSIGAQGRADALSLFGKDTIKEQWQKYLKV